MRSLRQQRPSNATLLTNRRRLTMARFRSSVTATIVSQVNIFTPGIGGSGWILAKSEK